MERLVTGGLSMTKEAAATEPLWTITETGKVASSFLPIQMKRIDLRDDILRKLDDVRLAAVQRDSIVSPRDVEKLLRGRSSEVRAWLKTSVTPIEHPTGREMYILGEVLDALRGEA